jgi:hypothetical protein
MARFSSTWVSFSGETALDRKRLGDREQLLVELQRGLGIALIKPTDTTGKYRHADFAFL